MLLDKEMQLKGLLVPDTAVRRHSTSSSTTLWAKALSHDNEEQEGALLPTPHMMHSTEGSCAQCCVVSATAPSPMGPRMHSPSYCGEHIGAHAPSPWQGERIIDCIPTYTS